MNRSKLVVAVGIAASLLAGAGHAASVNLSFNNGSLFNTAGISTFDVNGADMAGASVTACFSVGGCQTRAWGNLGGTSGGVLEADWSIRLNADSFANRFILQAISSTASLVSLAINGRPGLVAFDVASDGNGSPGSALGLPFSLMNDPGLAIGNIDVVYSDKLAVNGVFYDDLYTVMTLNFSGGTGFNSRARIEFMTDTDKTLNGAPIVPSRIVPTPSTFALVGLGLLGLAGQARRRAHS